MRKTALIVFLSMVAFLAWGCVKNPDTGELEPDYPTIAKATEFTTQGLAFKTLQYMDEKHPHEVVFVRSSFESAISICMGFTDGTLSVGDVVRDINIILVQINQRFEKVDPDTAELVSGMIQSLSSLLENIVLKAVHENGVIVIDAFAKGVNGGVAQYDAWAASSIPTTAGVMP